jgi:hypothetical protein
MFGWYGHRRPNALLKARSRGADAPAVDEFNFGRPGRRAPHVSLSPTVLVAVGGLIVAGLVVFAFMSFVSKGGHEVATAQATAVQQADLGEDRSAQATLRNALVAAKTQYTDTGTYEGLTPADLSAIEPDLTYTDGPSLDTLTVSLAVQEGRVGLAVLSASGTCFYVKDDPAAGVFYGSGTMCTGVAALAAADHAW